ncbi:MAG: hypothetical protein M0R51_00775 [Clostridia bacterium]|nr:hypothetical protein [Clostridia bacterium]
MIADYITNTKQFCQLKNSFLNKRFMHAHMLVYSDSFLLFEFSKLLATLIVSSDIDCKSISYKKVQSGCHPDVMVIDNQKGIMVDDIFKIVNTVNIKPLESNNKVYIIQNADTTNTQAQNKLLKTLEEPPKNVFIILNVQNPSKILSTVTSRCNKTNIELLDKQSICDILKIKYGAENLQKILKCADLCEGKLGRALELYEQENLLKIYDFVLDLFTNMKKSADVLKYSSTIINSKENFNEIINFMLLIVRDMLLINSSATQSVLQFSESKQLKNVAENFSNQALLHIIDIIVVVQKNLSVNCNITAVTDMILMSILGKNINGKSSRS